jgi:pyruvate dehydrogenase E2 component (dihydrolipoamide acetyltransferase)
MASQVVMPKIGLTMQEGKVVEWRKKEGDKVEKGDILFVFETEKTTFEVEAPETGVLGKILVRAEETVAVGTVVGLIHLAEEGGEEKATAGTPSGKAKEALRESESQPKQDIDVKGAKIRATPLARRLAREKRLDLKSIPGNSVGGRIRRADVEKFLAGKLPAPTAAPQGEKGKLVKFTGMRRIIAQKMLASKVETAQIYMSHTIDATRILDARERLLPVVEKRTNIRLTITDLLLKVAAVALARHPVINTRWTSAGVLWLEEIHMGLAMALEEGLIVPVIRDIGRMSLSAIAKARGELVEKGRKGKLIPDDLKGSTFTLSSLGMYGIEEFCAIINQPESAILGVGGIIDKPVAIAKEISVRPMMKMTLSYDHRIIDGARAAEFMRTLKELMENPILTLA